METNHTLSVGTASGTLLSIAPTIVSSDVLKTVVLAMIGAVVSFLVSWILKRFFK
ncbi:hypothetical protein V3Q90_06260 [Flavobacterium oreochromis]|uniref:Holin n=1 Tax=Flavobacterium davisii TaxID=2906077 RepID=A0ABW8PLL5_9FLAO